MPYVRDSRIGNEILRGDDGQKGALKTRDHAWYPPKNLLGLPWRVAFALQDDGWVLRSCHSLAQAEPDA